MTSTLRGPFARSAAIPGDTSSFFLPQAESTLASPSRPQDADYTADLTASTVAGLPSSRTITPLSRASPTISNPTPPPGSHMRSDSGASMNANPNANAQALALAQIAQMRALILGFEERSEAREARIAEEKARAEGEVARFEAVRREIEGVGAP